MSRGPAKIASAKSVLDRVRRAPPDTWWGREAKRLVAEGDLLAAMDTLRQAGIITYAHVHAFERWLEQQDIEDLA